MALRIIIHNVKFIVISASARAEVLYICNFLKIHYKFCVIRSRATLPPSQHFLSFFLAAARAGVRAQVLGREHPKAAQENILFFIIFEIFK